ncbi:sugar ABC transporter substrate-binding protein [Caloramator australicus]|uniref:Extracellular solute-binding protein, family 1 n=1 Tax=Caloramator australicus RC3 TaxID=857293 RepID=I7LIT3_9CLOT|nr:extracellular solute-binding protein [Caloramator australicus]CCJ33202.1 extracellular solute-binding protein, family 1 [Caloramator australicus RC3]
MLKKLLSLFMSLTVLLGLLSGCSKQTSSDDTEKFKGKEVTIYIRMMEAQDKWFRENIIAAFEQKYGVKINVRTFEKDTDLHNILELDKDKNTIALVKVPFMQIYPLAKKGLIMSLDEAVGEKYKEDIKEYVDKAIEMATIDGKVYYIPRKLETNTLLYLKSKVEDAVNNWEKMKPQINKMFKKENGYGLPDGYTLEADPNQWDWYDLAVVGYYWANTPYNGTKEPRIAHRAKKYEGTVIEIMTKVYQMGGNQDDMLAMNTQPVKDTFQWEAFFKKNGLYNPAMWQEGWSGGGIWNAMAQGKVFLAFMHQIDAFFIHGGSDPSMQGFLANPDDMGLAIMPMGASLEIKDGQPARVGGHHSQAAGWWWGIPKSTPDKELSYTLARFITNKENHAKECATFGMMPIRKDIYENLNENFKEVWMQDVFKTAMEQESQGILPAPMVSQWPAIQNLYLEAWYDIVVGDKDYSKTLDEVYAPKAKQELSK